MKGAATKDFFNLYQQGFIRTAVCTPEVRIADPEFNARETIRLACEAASRSACLALFPEMGISAYSNEDLFHQDALLQGVREALAKIIAETAALNLFLAVGAPLEIENRLHNCGVVLYRGKILGVAIKSYLPNYREFYEARQFSPAFECTRRSISLCGQEEIPCGADLLFEVTNIRHFRFFLEICEDVWVPVPPSCFAALAGATVIGNLSASNVTIGKAEYRHALAANQSGRCLAGYLFSA
ncbi:MAG: NAD(+) synthase, partial [Syntrophaceae bacterium]|nr:NAD(+) synthase [Syntrophaceae bacterium]